MKIDHIAIWTNNIERLRTFYTKYFDAKSNDRYFNPNKNFQSYFLSFENSARLEIMQMPSIPDNLNNTQNQYIGIIHLSISVGSQDKVNPLTEQLRSDGYTVVSEPRYTGDGYFESCVLDPDGNRVEITI